MRRDDNDNVFGSIVTGRDVRLAMIAHLQLWFPTYLAETYRDIERDPADVPNFRSWVSGLDMPEGKYEEHQMPSCIVVAPGLIQTPERDAGGFRAVWSVNVGAVVSGQDRDGTFELAEIYAAAVRAAVLHKPGLGGFATATDWLGERYDDIENDMLRTLAAGTVQFGVEVHRALDRNAGPEAPLPDPTLDPGPRATFVEVDHTLEGV